MKKFVIQAFQQKYYLPSKVKEKSATYLKNVQKIGKNLPTIKLIRKANIKRKQNQHLSSAQKFVISFVYNFIWKRLSYSFLDLITPSIVKSNQLTKITDYRSNFGFCEGSDLLCPSTSNRMKITEKVIKCSNHSNFYTENKFCKSSVGAHEKSCQINNEFNLKSNELNGSQRHSFYSIESCNENENEESRPNKQTQQPHLIDLKKFQQEDINSECREKKKINNREGNKQNYSIPSTSLNDMKRNTCKDYNPFDSNSNLQSYEESLNKEKCIGRIQGTACKIDDKHVGNINESHSWKTSDDLTSSKLNESIDTPSAIKTYHTPKIKKLNKQPSFISRQRLNKGIEARSVVEGNGPLKTHSSLRIRGRGKELYVSLTKDDYTVIDNQAFSLDKKTFLKSVSKIDVKQENLERNCYSSIKKNKNHEQLTQKTSKTGTEQEAGNKIPMINEPYNKNLIKRPQVSKENSNISKYKKSSLPGKMLKTNKTKESKPTKSYKKKKRKRKFNKKLMPPTQEANNFQSSNIKDNLLVDKNSVDCSSFNEYKLQNTKSLLTEAPQKVKSDLVINCLDDKEKTTLKYCKKETNQAQLGISDDSVTALKIGKTDLIVFDTTQDEAQLLVHEQRFGDKIKCNLIDLNTVISEENSPIVSKKYQSKTKSPQRNIDSDQSEIKLKKNDIKNLKPAIMKPWKKNKDKSIESRNKHKKENIKSNNNNVDSERVISKETLVDSKPTTILFEKKTRVTNENDVGNKNDKVIPTKHDININKKQVKEEPTDSSNSTKNLEYQNAGAIDRAVPYNNLDHPFKESTKQVDSSSRLTLPKVVTNTTQENKLEKQTQDVGSPVACSKQIPSNWQKKVPTFSNTPTVLESKSDNHLSDKKEPKEMASFQNPGSLNSKTLLKPTNKTNLESNDLLLTKTMADISQGLNKIQGKEEFKLKMNHLLHNFTVTGQKQKANNIQKRIKSQELVIVKREIEKKANKTISQESVADKSNNSKQLNVKLTSHEPLSKKLNSTKDKMSNNKQITKTNVSGNTSFEKNALSEKRYTKPLTVSVRPALSVPKDTKSQENITRSGEKNIHRPVAKIKNTTSIISSPKAKTLVSNKSEQLNVGKTTHGEVKQHVTANSNPKNSDVNKKGEKSTITANNLQKLSTNNEKLKKLGKKHPLE